MARSTSTLDRPDTVPASPPAHRGRPPRWRDTRVLLGVGLVAVCVVVGVRLGSSGEPRTEVWRAARDLSAGALPTGADLERVSLPLGDVAAAYLPGSQPPDGRLVRDLRAGELVPVSALDSATPADVRWVTVPVEPLHTPTGLAPGDRVDVWSTAREDVDTATARPMLVRTAVLVASTDSSALGAGGESGVVLEVPADAADDLVAAVRSGAVDLVRVPAGVS